MNEFGRLAMHLDEMNEVIENLKADLADKVNEQEIEAYKRKASRKQHTHAEKRNANAKHHRNERYHGKIGHGDGEKLYNAGIDFSGSDKSAKNRKIKDRMDYCDVDVMLNREYARKYISILIKEREALAGNINNERDLISEYEKEACKCVYAWADDEFATCLGFEHIIHIVDGYKDYMAEHNAKIDYFRDYIRDVDEELDYMYEYLAGSCVEDMNF